MPADRSFASGRSLITSSSGATIDLSGLQTLQGRRGDDAIEISALDSGSILLNSLEFIAEGSTRFTANGENTVLDLLEVAVLSGSASALTAVNGGQINLDPNANYSLASIEITVGETSSISAGTLVLDAQSTLSGGGTVNGNVVNDGPLSPAGTLTITGDYTQSPNGSLQIDVSGFETDEFDELVVTGNVTLGGSLTIDVASEFTPSSSDPTFSFVSFVTTTGEFSSTELAGYELRRTTTSLNLAVPETLQALSAVLLAEKKNDSFASVDTDEYDVVQVADERLLTGPTIGLAGAKSFDDDPTRQVVAANLQLAVIASEESSNDLDEFFALEPELDLSS